MNKASYSLKYYRKNRERRNRETLEYNKRTGFRSQTKYALTYRPRMKRAVYELLGRKCIICGFDDIRALQIDHVNGNGSKEKKLVKGNYYKFLLTDIVSNPNKYQVLCANCNWIKRAEKKEVRGSKNS